MSPVSDKSIDGARETVVLVHGYFRTARDMRRLLAGMADFIAAPYVHTQLHRRVETARPVDRFLRTGRFGEG